LDYLHILKYIYYPKALWRRPDERSETEMGCVFSNNKQKANVT